MLMPRLRHTTACAFVIAAAVTAPSAFAQEIDADAVAEPNIADGTPVDDGMIVVTASTPISDSLKFGASGAR